ncbi:hypothetical protein D3C84_1195130 [compost metagenome]
MRALVVVAMPLAAYRPPVTDQGRIAVVIGEMILRPGAEPGNHQRLIVQSGVVIAGLNQSNAG